MARKPEAQYTAAVGKLIPPSVYALKLSLPYTAGVADSWYSGPARDLWVEWKYLQTIPPSVDCNGLLTKLQAAWLRDRHHEGRSVAVIVASRSGGVMFPGLSWQIPVTRADFLAKAQTKRDLANHLTFIVSDLTERAS